MEYALPMGDEEKQEEQRKITTSKRLQSMLHLAPYILGQTQWNVKRLTLRLLLLHCKETSTVHGHLVLAAAVDLAAAHGKKHHTLE